MSTISLKQALTYGINELNKLKMNSARLDAEILLGFVLGLSREKMLSNPQYPISNIQYLKFKKLIAKRKKHYPIAYLTGLKEFYGIDFFVNENVLVPRPETELLVKSVIDFCRRGPAWSPECRRPHGVAPTILEIGTGSGCIALTLAKYLPKAKITATDISAKALVVACGNRRNLGIKNVKLLKSNLLEKVKTKPDIIVANLPYLTKKELKEISISREPRLALYGGKEGMESYEKLFKQIKSKWFQSRDLINQISTMHKKNIHGISANSRLTIFLEIGENQAKKIRKVFVEHFPYTKMSVVKDLSGHDRVVVLKHENRGGRWTF